MEGQVVTLALAIGIHAAVAFVLAAMYVETRFRYVAWWTAGAAMLTMRAALELSLLSTPQVPVLLLRNALLLAGAGFFLTGSAARDPRVRGIAVAGLLGFGGLVFAAAGLLLIGPGGPVTRDAATARLLTELAAGAAFLLAAEGYRRAEQLLDDLATWILFVGLLAIGLNAIGWAWVPRTAGTAAGSELLGALCILLFGAGMELRSLQRARRLEVLSQISAALQQPQPVRDLLQNVLRQAGELLQIHTGWVFLHDPGMERYELAATYHLPRALDTDHQGAMRGSCRCLDLLLANQLTEPVNIINCVRLEGVGIKVQHASVPLRTSTGIAGLMNLVLPTGRQFSQRELALLSTVGGEVGLAVEQARLLGELQEKERIQSDLIKRLLTAHEDERRRIARELHDETGQSITALILNIDRVRALAKQGKPGTADALDGLKGLAETTLEEVRKLIYDLRPTILDDLGLAAALRWYVQQQIEPRGLRVNLTIRLGDARLDPTLETAVFRIAQEALWNVVKHAGATFVDVELTRNDDHVRLRVKDNGRGIQADGVRQPDVKHGGAGLGGMQERAALMGGVARITSRPNEGTEVVAEFPLPALSA